MSGWRLIRSGALADERGSGGIAGVAVIGVLCTLLVAIAPLGGALAARQQLQGTADSAALAAADTASGRVPGEPCAVAAAIASALGAALSACDIDARGIARVHVTATVLGVAIDASARAGPPVAADASARAGPPNAVGAGAERSQPTMAST